MKLNIGCGNRKSDGFVNLDIDKSVKPDVLADLSSGNLPFKDNTFNEITATHILEHIGDGFMNLIKEIYRVSENNATINIVVPHYNHWTFHADPTHVRVIDINMFNLFNKEWCRHDKLVNNGSSNYAYLYDVDFRILEYSYRPEIEYENLPFDQLQEMVKKYNNVASETYIKLIVIKTD